MVEAGHKAMTDKPKPKQDSKEALCNQIHYIEPVGGSFEQLHASLSKASLGDFRDWTKDELKPHKPRPTDLTVAKLVARALGAKI